MARTSAFIQIRTNMALITDLEKEEHNEKGLYGGEERGVIGGNCLVDSVIRSRQQLQQLTNVESKKKKTGKLENFFQATFLPPETYAKNLT